MSFHLRLSLNTHQSELLTTNMNLLNVLFIFIKLPSEYIICSKCSFVSFSIRNINYDKRLSLCLLVVVSKTHSLSPCPSYGFSWIILLTLFSKFTAALLQNEYKFDINHFFLHFLEKIYTFMFVLL